MSLRDHLVAVVQAIGADIKALQAAVGGGGGGDVWTRRGLAADHVSATTAFADVAGWSVQIPANTNFTIEGELILLAGAAATNLPRFGLNWNAALARAVGEVWYHSSATAKVTANALNLAAAGNLQMAGGTAPALNQHYSGGFFLKGRTGGSAVTIKAQLAAESAAANAAQLKVGSEFRSRTGP